VARRRALVAHLFEESLVLTGSSGRYELEIGSTWEGQRGKAYGGFAAAAVLRAAGLLSSASRPASFACQFLRPVALMVPCEFDVVSLRRGRTSDLLSVSVSQSGKPALHGLVRTVDESTGPDSQPARRPAPADPTSLPRDVDVMRVYGWRPSKLAEHIECRMDMDIAAAGGHAAWQRLGEGIVYDDPFLEAGRYLMILDNAAPAIVNQAGYFWGPRRKELPWGFANLDLLVHFHVARGTDWLYMDSEVIAGSGGLSSAQTQVWSDSAELLATGISQVHFFPIPE
jgi:acyl-CoA thioesterase